MNAKTYFNALSANIPAEEIANKAGLSYLSAASAVRLADYPSFEFVDFDGQPFLSCLNGGLVAVDIPVVVDSSVKTQRTWLPVLDEAHRPLALKEMSVTDVNNSRQRCLVKAIASVFGHGMSLYIGTDGSGEKASNILGVRPDSVLKDVPPVIANLRDGGAPYIEWSVSLAACCITDPSFTWDVVMWDGLPYRVVLGSVMVDVDTVYHGVTRRLSLPVMDRNSAGDFQAIPADKVTVFDWNKTVMRCLTKCVAFNTGYGIGVYADEFSSSAKGTEKSKSSDKKNASTTKSDKAAAEPVKSTQQSAAAASSTATEPAPEKVENTPAQAEGAQPTQSEPTATQAESQPSNAAQSTAAADAAANPPSCILRFKGVMQKRREAYGVPGLLSLFDAMHSSTKFAEEEKPLCFAFLVPAVTAVMTETDIDAMLVELTKYHAMQYLALDTRDMVGAKLTALLLNAECKKGDEALAAAPSKLVEAGVAVDLMDVVRLADLGSVPAETMDLLASLVDPVTA